MKQKIKFFLPAAAAAILAVTAYSSMGLQASSATKGLCPGSCGTGKKCEVYHNVDHNPHWICVSQNAIPAHLNHGDPMVRPCTH